MSIDLGLFVDHAAWLAPRLQDPTRLGVMTWLGRRLEPDARERFAAHFPLSHDVQRNGERALCSLLARPIMVNATRLRPSEDVNRAVDWSATYSRAILGVRPPQPFLCRTRHPVPDRSTLGALVSLARSWERMLGLAERSNVAGRDYRHRRAALRAAAAPQLVRGLAPTPFGSRHAARLRRLDEQAAAEVAHIESAIGFWNRAFGSSEVADHAAFNTVGRLLDDADARNIDTLMEATVALSVARAALTAERPDWPTLFPWQLIAVDEPKGRYPVIRLQSGDLVCEIAKGTPLGGVVDGRRSKIADQLSPWADEVLPATGSTRSSGRQPDLVVSFWFDGDPSRVVFALGDAKRNATGDGEGYIRVAIEVAATYLMSFGHKMGLTMPTATSGHRTQLMPGVTLFCRQGTGRDSASAVAMLRRDEAPVVMAFDLEGDMAPGVRPWRAAWLGLLAREAVVAPGAQGQGLTTRAKPWGSYMEATLVHSFGKEYSSAKADCLPSGA